MKIQIVDGLPFVSVSLTHHHQELALGNVLLDTGLVGTIFATDELLKIGLQYEADDVVHRIRGVGGSEFVFTKKVDCLAIGNLLVKNFDIEVGGMDYGFHLNGIVGMDFLLQVGAKINLAQLDVM